MAVASDFLHRSRPLLRDATFSTASLGRTTTKQRVPMPHDKNKSPVGWYFGSYLLRFIELDDKNRNDPNRRFTSWENTVLVQAKTIEAAYSKVERIGKQNSKPYRGGPQGVPVQWEFLGVTELLPIYEEIADGAEIAWAERAPRKLKNLEQWVRPKSAIRQ